MPTTKKKVLNFAARKESGAWQRTWQRTRSGRGGGGLSVAPWSVEQNLLEGSGRLRGALGKMVSELRECYFGVEWVTMAMLS